MEEPTPKMGRKKLTTGMISTLKNVASLKEAIPPRRDFIAFLKGTYTTDDSVYRYLFVPAFLEPDVCV